MLSGNRIRGRYGPLCGARRFFVHAGVAGLLLLPASGPAQWWGFYPSGLVWDREAAIGGTGRVTTPAVDSAVSSTMLISAKRVLDRW